MGRQVVIADPAADDLRGIVAYIARNNPTAAIRLGQALLDLALSLGDLPSRGALHRRNPEIRKLSYRGYKIYYHLPARRNVVEILHFWHAARRDPQLEA